MFAVFLAAMAVQSQAPPATPPPDATPVSPVTVTAPAPDAETVAANLADLYDKSCGGRIYGMYADACNNLAAQLRKAQADARKAARAKPAAPHPPS